MKLRLAPVSEVSDFHRVLLAELAYESLASYYARLSENKAATALALNSEFDEPHTELGTTHAAFRHDVMAGMIAAYPAEEMADRQRASLFCHLECDALNQERVLSAASVQARAIPTLPVSHFYIARIAITVDFRGLGVADTLINHVKSAVPTSRPISLHVHKDNGRAMAFYRRMGFVRTDEANLAFHTLTLRR